MALEFNVVPNEIKEYVAPHQVNQRLREEYPQNPQMGAPRGRQNGNARRGLLAVATAVVALFVSAMERF